MPVLSVSGELIPRKKAMLKKVAKSKKLKKPQKHYHKRKHTPKVTEQWAKNKYDEIEVNRLSRLFREE